MKRILLLASLAAAFTGCAALRAREPNLAMPSDPMYMSEDCRAAMEDCIIMIGDRAQCRKDTGC